MEKEVFIIEMDGIIKTIESYTNDPFINSYTRNLKISVKNKENEISSKLIIKLLEWYEQNMDVIEKDEFVFNLKAHRKSFLLLKEYFETY